MKRKFFCSLTAIAVLAAGCVDDTTAPVSSSKRSLSIHESAPRHIVAFKSMSVPADFVTAVEAAGGTVELSLHSLGGAVVSGLAPDAVAAIAARADVHGVEAEEAFTLEYRASDLETDVAADIASPAQPSLALNYSRQWNMRAVNAPAAWSAGRLGSATTIAAILDTGIDYTLPDLNGRVDLSLSKSFVPQDDQIMTIVFPGRHVSADLDGHGTNVATQVASNGLRYAGVTSGTRLISVKVCGFIPGNCPGGAILAGIEYAVQAGAAVINMSLGGGFLKNHRGPSVALFNRAFQFAEQNGTTVVVSAGNSGFDMDHFPNAHFTYCDQTHVICVSALGPKDTGPNQNGFGPFADQDEPAFYTNYGRSRIDVGAPGGNYVLSPLGGVVSAGWIWSHCSRQRLAKVGNSLYYTTCSLPANQNSLFSVGYAGTSQASPHVAGLAALLASELGKSPAQIRARIAKGSDDLGQPGEDAYYGAGRINVGNTK